MAKAFSIEDGNLSNTSVVGSSDVSYKDIDLTFTNKPSGDLFKKTDAAAVKQAVKNLLLTNNFEKPFRPTFGGNLNDFLFSLDDEFDEIDVKERIVNAIQNHEPRALPRRIDVDIRPDYNSVNVKVIFQVITTNELVELNVSLARLR